MKIFIICSVRGMADEYRNRLENYVKVLESSGNKVHLPHRDTKQDTDGWSICIQNCNAISDCDEVHIFYSPKSQGTHFDIGVAFALRKKIKIIDVDPEVANIPGKSFINMLKQWELK